MMEKFKEQAIIENEKFLKVATEMDAKMSGDDEDEIAEADAFFDEVKETLGPDYA